MGSAPITTATSQVLATLLGLPVVSSSSLHALPVHAGLVIAEHLKTIETKIPHSCSGVMRDHHAEGNEATAIMGPALENRQPGQIGSF